MFSTIFQLTNTKTSQLNLGSRETFTDNVTLNTKIIGRGNNLDKVKETCGKVKQEVLQCIINNINDQNGNDESLAALMSIFDLSTN